MIGKETDNADSCSNTYRRMLQDTITLIRTNIEILIEDFLRKYVTVHGEIKRTSSSNRQIYGDRAEEKNIKRVKRQRMTRSLELAYSGKTNKRNRMFSKG